MFWSYVGLSETVMFSSYQCAFSTLQFIQLNYKNSKTSCKLSIWINSMVITESLYQEI